MGIALLEEIRIVVYREIFFIMRIVKKLQAIFPACLKKLHLNKFVYKIMTVFTISKDKLHDMDLSSVWPDRGKSSVEDNEIMPSPQFDLQIVVPAYNVASYIEECVNSILSQKTVFSFKVIIVNDGSTDNTRNILKKYEGHQNVEIVDQENGGLSKARNTGIHQIDARYVMFVDSDDIVCAGAIDILMKQAQIADADIVEGSFARFDRSGTLSMNLQIDSENNRGVSGFAWGKIYKSELFKHICFPEGYWYEDTFIYPIILPMAKKIATVSALVYKWRRNESSITAISKGNIKCIDSLWVTKRFLLDKCLLEQPIDVDTLDFFLWQVRVNFGRIATLCSTSINETVFIATCTLFDVYGFAQLKPSRFFEIYKSLLEGNYSLYYWACSLL